MFPSNDEPHDVDDSWKKCPKCYRATKKAGDGNDDISSSSSSSESSPD